MSNENNEVKEQKENVSNKLVTQMSSDEFISWMEKNTWELKNIHCIKLSMQYIKKTKLNPNEFTSIINEEKSKQDLFKQFETKEYGQQKINQEMQDKFKKELNRLIIKNWYDYFYHFFPNINKPKNSINMNKFIYGLGLCLGSAIGDSLGSYIEFERGPNITDKIMKKLMSMPGGGCWGEYVNPGQITDDTELAISLGFAIQKMIKTHSKIWINDFLIEYYRKWIKSGCFDKGNCTSSTIGALIYKDCNINDIKSIAKRYNDNSNFAESMYIYVLKLIIDININRKLCKWKFNENNAIKFILYEY